MNRLKKKYLISSSTQTQTQTDKKDKKLLKNRILSYQDIRLKLEQSPIYIQNLSNSNRIQNQLKGKKILKKKVFDLYSIYINSTTSKEKNYNTINSKSGNNIHKKGNIFLSFGNNQTIDRKNNVHDLKNNFLICRKIFFNDKANNTYYKNNNKKIFKLFPICNIKKTLNSNNTINGFYINNKTDNRKKNQFEEIQTNSHSNYKNKNYREKLIMRNFPSILKSRNFKSSTNIKKDNELIVDFFRKKIFKKNKNINYFNDHKRLNSCESYENYFNINNLNSFKDPTENNFMKKNIKILLNNFYNNNI